MTGQTTTTQRSPGRGKPAAGRPGWQVRSPASGSSADDRWHASNGTTDLAAGSFSGADGSPGLVPRHLIPGPQEPDRPARAVFTGS